MIYGRAHQSNDIAVSVQMMYDNFGDVVVNSAVCDG